MVFIILNVILFQFFASENEVEVHIIEMESEPSCLFTQNLPIAGTSSEKKYGAIGINTSNDKVCYSIRASSII